MGEISRRQLLIRLGLLASAGVSMPGCCLIRKILGKPCDPLDTWKKNSRSWWKNRQAWRERERQIARESGERPDVALPIPYLECNRVDGSRGNVAEQWKTIPLNQWGEISVAIENKGNAPSWSCFVELYEGPWSAYDVRYEKMRLTGRKIIAIQPGEIKEVVLAWQKTRVNNGHLIMRCYDPIQDPGILTYQQLWRQNSGFGWYY